MGSAPLIWKLVLFAQVIQSVQNRGNLMLRSHKDCIPSFRSSVHRPKINIGTFKLSLLEFPRKSCLSSVLRSFGSFLLKHEKFSSCSPGLPLEPYFPRDRLRLSSSRHFSFLFGPRNKSGFIFNLNLISRSISEGSRSFLEEFGDHTKMNQSMEESSQSNNVDVRPITEDTLQKNYVLAKVPKEGNKIWLHINWEGREINLERQRTETIFTTLSRLKRTLAKSEKLQNCVPYDPNLGHSVAFLTDKLEAFEESTNCEEAVTSASFISINDTLLQIYTNFNKLQSVLVGDRIMAECPVSIKVKAEDEERLGEISFTVEWLDSLGNVLHNGMIYVPPKSSSGSRVKVRVTNDKMKWNVVESQFSMVEEAPYCRWQIERISEFNNAPKKIVDGRLQSNKIDTRVVSFNILSPTYVSSSDAILKFFPYCQPQYLETSYRNQLILREILLLKPRILCIQECSSSVYKDCISQVLCENYFSFLTIKSSNVDEGSATFVQKDAFTPLEKVELVFKDLIKSKEYEPFLKRVSAKWRGYDSDYFSKYHSIYQLGFFRSNTGETPSYLFTVNTHLYFHPDGRHIRLLQAYVLLNEIEKLKLRASEKYKFDIESDSYTVICGDFNSFPNEGVYHLITNGYVSYDHPDWKFGETFGYEKSSNFTPGDFGRDANREFEPLDTDPSNEIRVPNCKGYPDAYSGTKLEFTNFVHVFHGTLDYIFHSRNVKAKRCMPGITKQQAQENIGLPSKLYPSDHLSISVDF